MTATEEPQPFMLTDRIAGAGHHLDVQFAAFRDDGTAVGKRLAGAREVIVRAGNRGVERIVPPAGDLWAFDRPLWEREVMVYVSPTGRSVRVFVDGIEIPRAG
jgi:hypothetical protein